VLNNTGYNEGYFKLELETYTYALLNGIELYYSNHSIIRDCEIRVNVEDAITLLGCSNCTIVSNNIINNERFGVDIYYSNNITITNNTISENRRGIRIGYSDNCLIVGNLILSNVAGLQFHWFAHDILVVNNSILHNEHYGIVISSYCTGITFYGNVLGWNGNAPYYEGGGNVDDYGTNIQWDDGVGTGNSWSDYYGIGVYEVPPNGTHIDHYPSGIGLTPFMIQVAVVVGVSIITPVLVIVVKKKRRGSSPGLEVSEPL
jgi:parallel beta-helix repeat protein